MFKRSKKLGKRGLLAIGAILICAMVVTAGVLSYAFKAQRDVDIKGREYWLQYTELDVNGEPTGGWHTMQYSAPSQTITLNLTETQYCTMKFGLRNMHPSHSLVLDLDNIDLPDELTLNSIHRGAVDITSSAGAYTWTQGSGNWQVLTYNFTADPWTNTTAGLHVQVNIPLPSLN